MQTRNNISFLECFEKHLDNINFDNEIFLLGDFNINLLHSSKYILKEMQAVGSRIVSTSLVSQYNLFCQRFSLEQIIKYAPRTTCSSFTLIDYVLTNFRGKDLTRWCYRYRYFSTPVNPLTTNVTHHIETSQLICILNQLTGFYMMGNISR